MKIEVAILSALGVVGTSSVAMATVAAVPAPIVGAVGPAGLLVAAAAYVGYRIWKKRSDT